MPMQPPVKSAISPHNSTIRQAVDRMYNSNLAGAKMKQPEEKAEQFFKLGMMRSTGAKPLDMIEAHKWFNIAATLGMKEAIRLRNEVASEMSEREIAAAQRAARDWLVRH